MNRFFHHYNTPKGRHKTIEFDACRVSTGANAKIDGRWQTVSVSARWGLSGDSYIIQMDRETAERVVKQLSAYLADTTPAPGPTLATRSG